MDIESQLFVYICV